jgi:hypothetical protein
VPASNSVPRSMGLGMATAGTLGAHAAWRGLGQQRAEIGLKMRALAVEWAWRGYVAACHSMATPWWRTAGGTCLHGGPRCPWTVWGGVGGEGRRARTRFHQAGLICPPASPHPAMSCSRCACPRSPPQTGRRRGRGTACGGPPAGGCWRLATGSAAGSLHRCRSPGGGRSTGRRGS